MSDFMAQSRAAARPRRCASRYYLVFWSYRKRDQIVQVAHNEITQLGAFQGAAPDDCREIILKQKRCFGIFRQ